MGDLTYAAPTQLGGSKSLDLTSEQAIQMAWKTHQELKSTYEMSRSRRVESTDIPECSGRMMFVEGILHFCTTEALKSGHLKESEDVTREKELELAKESFHVRSRLSKALDPQPALTPHQQRHSCARWCHSSGVGGSGVQNAEECTSWCTHWPLRWHVRREN